MLRRFFFIISLLISLQVNAKAPVITSFSPAAGRVGSVVTITGTGFGVSSTVQIGGVPAITLSNANDQIQVMVMPGSVTGSLSVTTAGATGSSAQTFAVLPTPVPNTLYGPILAVPPVSGISGPVYAIAIDANGTTAAIAMETNVNAPSNVVVYTFKKGAWQLQAKLEEITPSSSAYVSSLAISADGNTIAAGDLNDVDRTGSVSVFKRTNGTWHPDSEKLVGEDPYQSVYQGTNVALSADGNTLMETGNADGIWLFIKKDGKWQRSGPKIMAISEYKANYGIALSADGSTAAISFVSGDTYLFKRSGDTYLPDGQVSGFGNLALSADGNLLVSGNVGQKDKETVVAKVYTRTAGVWSDQPVNLLAKDVGAFDVHYDPKITVSANGDVITLSSNRDGSNRGATWIFRKEAGKWSQYGDKLSTDNTAAFFGRAAALSADGTKLLVGAFDLAKSVYTFSTRPIAKTTPATAIAQLSATLNGVVDDNGGLTKVTITYGTAYDLANAVNATISKGVNPIPDGKGVVNFSADIAGLTSATTYFYRISASNAVGTAMGDILSFKTPAYPATISGIAPVSGQVGTLVTITGTNLTDATSVTMGDKPMVIVSNTRDKTVAMVMPDNIGGTISLVTSTGTVSAGSFNITATPLPNVQTGSKIKGSGAVGPAKQGRMIAMSADGSTAIMGAPEDDNSNGAAWIFVRNGNTWLQQGSKLVGSGAVKVIYPAKQGTAVAISADGNTVAIGGPEDDGGTGATWVFTRSNGIWTQQGEKIRSKPSIGRSAQGCAVALSADGNTLLTGASADNRGIGGAWVYTRDFKGAWIPQGPKLEGTGWVNPIGSDGTAQGITVALSADGNTAVLGAPNEYFNSGAVWMFTRNNGVWAQQDLYKFNGAGQRIGSYMALSADGNTIALGGNHPSDLYFGKVLVRNNNKLSLQYEWLVGKNGEKFKEGYNSLSVAITGDGNKIFIGHPGEGEGKGAVWKFVRNGDEWEKEGEKVITQDRAADQFFGVSVAISTDGNVMMAGGSGDAGGAGAAWAFTAQPNVVTGDAIDVKTNEATLTAAANANGSSSVLTIEFGTKPDLADKKIIANIQGSPLSPAAGKANFSVKIDGLAKATKYYFRIKAENANGVQYGFINNFTTIAGPPEISSFSPASGAPGAVLSIAGNNLTNLSSVTVGGKKAIIVSATLNALTAMIMPGTPSGTVVVTGPAGTAEGGRFEVSETSFPFAVTTGPLIPTGAENIQTSSQSVVLGMADATAISADGSMMALIGTEVGTGGTLWVFERKNGVWSEQTKMSAPTAPDGTIFRGAGHVAFNADGTTMVVSSGSVYNAPVLAIYTKEGPGWVLQQQIVGEISIAQALIPAVSADGNTIVVMGKTSGDKNKYIQTFIRSGNKWSLLSDLILPLPPAWNNFQSLALSADGKTLLTSDNTYSIPDYRLQVMARDGDKWKVTASLVAKNVIHNIKPPNMTGASRVGEKVALSADGTTAVASSTTDNDGVGALWAFKKTGDVWEQQGDKMIVGVDKNGLGEELSVSADGSIIMAADKAYYPAVYTFKLVNGKWFRQGGGLRANGVANQTISSFAMSADGSTAVSGTYRNPDKKSGGAYIYGKTNQVIYGATIPSYGTPGSKVEITGQNLDKVTSVIFGGKPVKSFTVNSSTSMSVILADDHAGLSTGSFKTSSDDVFASGFFIFLAPIITSSVSGNGVETFETPYIFDGVKFQWYKDGKPIDGATTNTLIPAGAGSYTVEASFADASKVSAPKVATDRFTLPADNFSVSATDLSCKGSANGIITVSARQALDYNATLKSTKGNKVQAFNNTTQFNNLIAGTYELCITIGGQATYKQCYTLTIAEPKDLFVFSTVKAGQQEVNISMSGGATYHITLNGTTTHTTDSLLSLPLKTGANKLIITTDRACQGIVEKTIIVNDKILPYPAPFEQELNVNLGTERTSVARVSIYSVFGNVVYKKQFNDPGAILTLDVSKIIIPGAYSLHLTTDGGTRIFKVLRK